MHDPHLMARALSNQMVPVLDTALNSIVRPS
jgi:hypothetical protein